LMEEPPGLRWALLSIGRNERFARESNSREIHLIASLVAWPGKDAIAQ
jgi:hypothetical protein